MRRVFRKQEVPSVMRSMARRRLPVVNQSQSSNKLFVEEPMNSPVSFYTKVDFNEPELLSKGADKKRQKTLNKVWGSVSLLLSMVVIVETMAQFFNDYTEYETRNADMEHASHAKYRLDFILKMSMAILPIVAVNIPSHILKGSIFSMCIANAYAQHGQVDSAMLDGVLSLDSLGLFAYVASKSEFMSLDAEINKIYRDHAPEYDEYFAINMHALGEKAKLELMIKHAETDESRKEAIVKLNALAVSTEMKLEGIRSMFQKHLDSAHDLQSRQSKHFMVNLLDETPVDRKEPLVTLIRGIEQNCADLNRFSSELSSATKSYMAESGADDLRASIIDATLRNSIFSGNTSPKQGESSLLSHNPSLFHWARHKSDPRVVELADVAHQAFKPK